MKKNSIKLKCIHSAIETGKSLKFKTYKYLLPERYLVDNILDKYLSLFGNTDCKNKIAYCIHELAVNAKKANTKRIYFARNNLDIDNENDYAYGMKSFKEDTIKDISRYIKLQEKADLHLQFNFAQIRNRLRISITNNVSLTTMERHRITNKFQKASSIKDMAEAYGSICDNTEGSGLGIVMTVLMLRSLGFPDNSLSIQSGAGKTETVFNLDFNMINREQISAPA